MVAASSELAGRKNRTNPLFPQEERLMYRQEAWRGGRQRLQASTRAPAAFQVAVHSSSKGVDKVPVLFLTCSAV